MLPNDVLRSTFDAGKTYAEYAASGSPDQQNAWADFHARAALTDAERNLVSGFVREMNIVVSSGVWCGDCVKQVPFLDHIERANPEKVRVRYVDRDEHMGFAERLQICGGLRVPVAVVANEEWDFLSLIGDRTLARYRAMAQKNLGAACPLPGAPIDSDEVSATRRDWVDEIERCQLICRLSTKLRAKHGD